MPLKGKFAMWEQKAASDTPKGPTMRPSSSMSRAGSRMGRGDDSGSVVGSVAGSEAGPFGPRKIKKKKKLDGVSAIEEAQAKINGNLNNQLSDIEKDLVHKKLTNQQSASMIQFEKLL